MTETSTETILYDDAIAQQCSLLNDEMMQSIEIIITETISSYHARLQALQFERCNRIRIGKN